MSIHFDYTSLGSPVGRYSHVTVWDSNNNRLIIYGGSIVGNPSNDEIWQYTIAGGWQLLASYPSGSPNTPGRREGLSGVWDGQLSRLLIFGGRDFTGNQQIHNDLWQYTEGDGWFKLTNDGEQGSPPVRSGTAVAWDSNNNRMLLQGGVMGSIDYNDFWEYSPAGWQVITPQNISVPPPTRNVHQIVWDNDQSRLYVFGGFAFNGANLNDLWAYSVRPLNLPPSVNANGTYSVLEGETVQLSATGSDPDNDSLIYAWDLDDNGVFENPGQNISYTPPIKPRWTPYKNNLCNVR